MKQNRRRPPPLFTFQGLLAVVGNGILGAASGTTGIGLTTVEGVRDLMQMITLLVTAGSPTLASIATSSSSYSPSQQTLLRTLFVTVPSALSLDFVSAFGQALLLLLLLTLVTLLALYELYRFTGGWAGPAAREGACDVGEGYDREGADAVGGTRRWLSWRDSYWWRVFVTFWCTSLYLPLSKLAIGALVYTDDYWPVNNPYIMYDSDSPSPPPLGPASTYFDSMDFCYRTTMKHRQGFKNLNFAYVLLPIASVVILTLSVWLPWRLYRVIEQEKPKVEGWTELGERRKDKNAEYERLLEVDPSPFSFLHCGASLILVFDLSSFLGGPQIIADHGLIVKLVNVLLVVLIQKNNCAFRSFAANHFSVIRQGCLFTFMCLFLGLSAFSSPYLDIRSNSSDLISRFGYVILAMLGLFAALKFPHTDPATAATNVVIYGFSAYFIVISKSFVQRWVKQAQRRLDFSIDIFSPHLDLSKHSADDLLCSPMYAMPPKCKLVFTKDPQVPPYLLNFGGTVAERFVEDLQILRDIGLDAYSDAVTNPESYLAQLRQRVRAELAGPDVFYRLEHSSRSAASHFGHLDVCPFPFVGIFRYDERPNEPLYLVQVDELEQLVEQNSSPAVIAARRVRIALRALEDQVIFRPHIESRQLGSTGAATVERHISGFHISLEYRDGEGVDSRGRFRTGQRLALSGPQFGVLPDFNLTQDLATLFRLNRHLIDERLPDIERHMRQHRDFFRLEPDIKTSVLSQRFLLSIFADDCLSTDDIDRILRTTEKNPNVQQMASLHKATFSRLEERMSAVANSAYKPMSRARFEAFLRDRSFSTTSRYSYFHPGLINQIYFYLEEQIFSPASRSIPIRFASSPDRVPFDQLYRFHTHDITHTPLFDERTKPPEIRPSRPTVTTGGGTDEDDRSIRERQAFVFEEVYEQPAPSLSRGHILAWIRFQLSVKLPKATKVFLGLEPCMRDWRPSENEGIVMDLRRGRSGWEAPRSRRKGDAKAGTL
ncbi:hypothetical protein Rt10032_c13g4969 [Rhodotorula toruloides]|uniref:Uncharacterized protein n=1 Tax=Rhodotorula toruloides TaxID=5286 RepID=A0A511KKP3_RHOTO|nr:hypothetical protein Rt10032_c13g4969 [Rhodotorula toruloides]